MAPAFPGMALRCRGDDRLCGACSRETVSLANSPSEAAMKPSLTSSLLGRRRLAAELAALAAGAAMAGRTTLAQTPALQPTPRQTAGPFYPVDWSGDVDADLVRVTGEAAHAQGVVTYLRGRVLDLQAQPVAG